MRKDDVEEALRLNKPMIDGEFVRIGTAGRPERR